MRFIPLLSSRSSRSRWKRSSGSQRHCRGTGFSGFGYYYERQNWPARSSPDQPLPLYDLSISAHSGYMAVRRGSTFAKANIPAKRWEGFASQTDSKGATWSDFYAWPSSGYWSESRPMMNRLSASCWTNAWPNRLGFDRPTRCGRASSVARESLGCAIRFFLSDSKSLGTEIRRRAQQRDDLCRKLAGVIRGLTLIFGNAEIVHRFQTFTLLGRQLGRFATQHHFSLIRPWIISPRAC